MYVSQDGNITVGNTLAPAYINLTAGTDGAPDAYFSIVGDGSISVKSGIDITYLGGGSSDASAYSTVGGSGTITHIAGRDLIMTAGTAANADVYLVTANGDVNAAAGRDMSLTAVCDLNEAFMFAVGNLSVVAGRDITLKWNAFFDQTGGFNIAYGRNYTVIECGTEPASSDTVSTWYSYVPIYELFYRLHFFNIYDWYTFHNPSFWDSTTYTDP